MTDEDLNHPFTPVAGTFTDMFRASKKPPEFIVEGLLPAGLVVMVGPPKEAFKSTISMALANMVAGFECKALPSEYKAVRTGPVMVFSYEADAGELRTITEEGLGVKGKADESILIAEEPDTFRLDDEQAVEQMLFWLNERRPKLVILDPLANFHSFEEKDATKMIQILSPLRRWAKLNDSCFLVVHHTRKLNEDRNYRADDARGSSAIFGLCDGIIIVSPSKDKLTVTLDCKFKRAPASTRTIQLGAWDFKGRGGEPLRDLDKVILNAVKHGYKTQDKIAEFTALKLELVRARTQLLITGGWLTPYNGKLKLLKEFE